MKTLLTKFWILALLPHTKPTIAGTVNSSHPMDHTKNAFRASNQVNLGLSSVRAFFRSSIFRRSAYWG